MKWLCGLFFVVLTLGMAAPAHAWGNLSDSQEPGSVLIFPEFHNGVVVTPDQGSLPASQFEISVVCPKGFDCSSVGTVTLRGHWVCAGDQTGICAETDFNLHTTINGTIFFDTNGNVSNPADFVPRPPCNVGSDTTALPEEFGSGYLIVWVTDASGNPLAADALLGHAVMRGSPLSARSYNAIPVQAVAATGTTIGTAGGPLLFDGSMYQQITGKIFGTFHYGQTFPTIETSLVLLTLDVQSNRVNSPTFADLNFYNENEQLISTSTNFTCWEKVDISSLAGGSLNTTFGTKGLVVSDAATQNGTPVTMVGLIETEEEFANPISITGPVTVTIPGSTVAGFCTLTGTFPFFTGISCGDITTTVTRTLTSSIGLTREYTYPFLNDSTPVSTTFFPF
jgi:hypothetical protein